MTWAVHLGDCFDPETGLASLPDQSVDHFICDPPYEVEGRAERRRVKRGKSLALEPLPFHITTEQRTALANEAARLARRWVIVFCQAEGLTPWREAFLAAGLRYKRAAVWIKPDAMPQLSGDRPGQGFKFIAMGHSARGRSVWNGGGRTGVYEFIRNGNGSEGNPHPTTKPMPLMEALVRDFTSPGELICDPFAGSGSTGVACRHLGRNFVGWELNPRYHRIATRRLDRAREQLEFFSVAPAAPEEQLVLPESI